MLGFGPCGGGGRYLEKLHGGLGELVVGVWPAYHTQA